jgi:hypothetical protein
MIRGSHVPERAESHRPEVELHDAISYLPPATRAQIHRVHPTIRLAVVLRPVVDLEPHTAVVRLDPAHVRDNEIGVHEHDRRERDAKCAPWRYR